MAYREAQTSRACGVGLILHHPAFVDDQNQVGVTAGAAEGVATPILNAVLDVEDGIAVVGIEPNIGDVVGVAGFYEDGVSGLESFGNGWLLWLGGCWG
jgi:hypothetical protein